MEMQAQSFALLEGFILGLFSGVLYDVIRVIRARLRFSPLGHFLDLLFWFTVTIIIFVWSQGAWGGRIRLYGVSALTLGAVFYFMTFTAITLWIGFRFADFVHFLIKIIYLPITALICLEKKIIQNTKNLFLFWSKWYRIESMTKPIKIMGQNQNKGGVDIAYQTGRNLHENRRRRCSNLSGRNPAHRRQSNSRCPSSQPTITKRCRQNERPE